jgi:hydrogenase maturation protease
MGNDILADDAVGLLAVRALRAGLDGRADVVETSVHGVALLDLLLGYDRAVLVDAMCTGRRPPGSVTTLDPADLSPAYAPSPHYAGLPEMIALAGALALEFPAEIAIVAVEVADPFTLGGPMTPAVRGAVPEICRRVRTLVESGSERGAA